MPAIEPPPKLNSALAEWASDPEMPKRTPVSTPEMEPPLVMMIVASPVVSARSMPMVPAAFGPVMLSDCAVKFVWLPEKSSPVPTPRPAGLDVAGHHRRVDAGKRHAAGAGIGDVDVAKADRRRQIGNGYRRSRRVGNRRRAVDGEAARNMVEHHTGRTAGLGDRIQHHMGGDRVDEDADAAIAGDGAACGGERTAARRALHGYAAIGVVQCIDDGEGVGALTGDIEGHRRSMHLADVVPVKL